MRERPRAHPDHTRVRAHKDQPETCTREGLSRGYTCDRDTRGQALLCGVGRQPCADGTACVCPHTGSRSGHTGSPDTHTWTFVRQLRQPTQCTHSPAERWTHRQRHRGAVLRHDCGSAWPQGGQGLVLCPRLSYPGRGLDRQAGLPVCAPSCPCCFSLGDTLSLQPSMAPQYLTCLCPLSPLETPTAPVLEILSCLCLMLPSTPTCLDPIISSLDKSTALAQKIPSLCHLPWLPITSPCLFSHCVPTVGAL